MQDVAGMMILNESQLRRGSVTPSLATLCSCFTVRYQDVKRVPQLEAAVTGEGVMSHLSRHLLSVSYRECPPWAYGLLVNDFARFVKRATKGIQRSTFTG